MNDSIVQDSNALMRECLNLPKIDLHAHLNGSIRRSTFLELLPIESQCEVAKLFNQMSYMNAFKIFSYIGTILSDLTIVRRVCREMLEDWNKHNVIYLEIRTTLKRINNTTKQDYLRTVLEEIDIGNRQLKMQTRLIISLNRDLPITEAEDTLNAFLSFESPLKKLVVGVDYCGDENRELMNWTEIVPILNGFKDYGLKITYHIAESKNYQMIDFDVFRPDRLGHTYFFSNEHVKQAIQHQIPVEFCPSSARFTLELESFKDIPWTSFYNVSKKLRHLICINTDDTLLFDSDLTKECFEICLAFDIDCKELKAMYLSTVDFIFETDEVFREDLRQKLVSYY